MSLNSFSNYLPESWMNPCALPCLVQVWHTSRSWTRCSSTHLLFICNLINPTLFAVPRSDNSDPSSHALFAAHQAGLIQFKPVQHRLNLVPIKLIKPARFSGRCWTQINCSGCSISLNTLIQVFTTMCLDQLNRCFQTNPACGCCRLLYY
jgi:hypothetical protein